MTIKSPDKFLAAVWDWSILDGCFGGTRISPSDVDGVVERGGDVLFLEAKGEGVTIPTGQRITYDTLAASGFTVIVVWGARDNPTRMRIWPQPEVECTLESFRAAVAAWYEAAPRIARARVEAKTAPLRKLRDELRDVRDQLFASEEQRTDLEAIVDVIKFVLRLPNEDRDRLHRLRRWLHDQAEKAEAAE